jgi:hypothetical protein
MSPGSAIVVGSATYVRRRTASSSARSARHLLLSSAFRRRRSSASSPAVRADGAASPRRRVINCARPGCRGGAEIAASTHAVRQRVELVRRCGTHGRGGTRSSRPRRTRSGSAWSSHPGRSRLARSSRPGRRAACHPTH